MSEVTVESIRRTYEFNKRFFIKFINEDSTRTEKDFERRYATIESQIEFAYDCRLITIGEWLADKKDLFDKTFEKRCILGGFYKHKGDNVMERIEDNRREDPIPFDWEKSTDEDTIEDDEIEGVE